MEDTESAPECEICFVADVGGSGGEGDDMAEFAFSAGFGRDGRIACSVVFDGSKSYAAGPARGGWLKTLDSRRKLLLTPLLIHTGFGSKRSEAQVGSTSRCCQGGLGDVGCTSWAKSDEKKVERYQGCILIVISCSYV